MSNQELNTQDIKVMDDLLENLKDDLSNILEMDNSLLGLAGTTRPQLREAAFGKFDNAVKTYVGGSIK